jgi:phosphoglycolate phosphatase-like HAD superfamily hydrolase/uncharacterized protein YjbJ (UPF0337 family)
VTRLVLWDIDGTLVDAAGTGRDAFLEAFERVTGGPLIHVVPFAGRTDLEIALDLLRAAGLDDAEVRLADFERALTEAFASRARILAARGRALPGAHAALARVAAEPGFHQGLLTGNLAPNARVKLAAFGLDGLVDLEIGGYGSDARHRPALVAVARARARERRGLDVGPADVVLVGDTPLDVAAAHEAGTRVVAVASGASSAEELRRAGADAVLGDLCDPEALMRALLDCRPVAGGYDQGFTLNETSKGPNMTDAKEPAGGLVGRVAGKAKEAAGELLDHDELAREGRLQQASVDAEQEAGQREAEAARERDAAEREAERTRIEAERARLRTDVETSERERQIEQDRQTAEQRAQAEATQRKRQADAQGQGERAVAAHAELTAEQERVEAAQRAAALERQADRHEATADAVDPEEAH